MTSTGPDAGGEGFYGGEAELLVEVDGGVVFGCDSQSQFVELLGAEGVRGGEHQEAAEAVPLETRHDAKLGGVADAGGDFAGEDRARKVLAAGLAEDEGGIGDELAAAG